MLNALKTNKKHSGKNHFFLYHKLSANKWFTQKRLKIQSCNRNRSVIFSKRQQQKKTQIFVIKLVTIECNTCIFFVAARSQHVQIQAVPPTVKYLENDLIIICSITNPSSLIAIISLELQRNESGSFQTIVSINQDQKPHWINTLLERRATVSGSVNDTNSTELKFSIDKKNVLCPEDFTVYKCKMSGYNYTISSNYIVHDEDQITITYTSMDYLNF